MADTMQVSKTQRMLEDLPLAAAALTDHVDDETHVRLRGRTVRDTNRARDPKTAINEDQAELLTDVKAIFDEVVERGGVQVATALNMHPWPINSTGPHLTGITLPLCPIEAEFSAFPFREYRNDFADRAGKYKVTPVWPIALLRDIQRQHENWGGIVVYMGDRVPGQAKNKVENVYEKIFSVLKKLTDKETKELLQQQIEEARAEQQKAEKETVSDADIRKLMGEANDRRILFYESMYQQAEQIAADPKENHRKIGHMHRMIARWMHKRGRYSVLPRWVSETKPRDFVEKRCPKCSATLDLDKEGNYQGYCCMKCNKILDPIRAFQAFPPEPGAKELLRYCSREALDAAGLKHVLTLAEEDAAEAKEAKKAEKEKGTK